MTSGLYGPLFGPEQGRHNRSRGDQLSKLMLRKRAVLMDMDPMWRVHLLTALRMTHLTPPLAPRRNGSPTESGDVKLLHLVRPHMTTPGGRVGLDLQIDARPK